jgi:hypothetical protein
VAILSAIPKRFELLVYRGMHNDLKNLVSINQHDFMKNRSTITNLLEYASFMLNSIEDGNQVDSIYTDFSKAFDRVRHQLLLYEMSVGIEPARYMSPGSYLSRRIKKIRIGDAVHQGDIGCSTGKLSGTTLLHLVCQQNIGDFRLRSCTQSFKIQSDLKKLSEWCDRNALLLNVGKCKTITFSRSRHPVKFS